MITTHPVILFRAGLVIPVTGVPVLIAYIWWNSVVEVLLVPAMKGEGSFAGVLLFLVATAGAVLTLWSFLATALTHPGRAPSFFLELHPTPLDRVDEDLPPELAAPDLPAHRRLARSMRRRPPLVGADGAVHCRICREPKPARCHHDRMSGQCVLRMDHFCPWVGNTVGLCNYKYFYQFVSYAAATCVVIAAYSIAGGVQATFSARRGAGGAGSFSALMASTLAVAFAFALSLFVVIHGVLISRNQTTIEAGQNDASYSLGSVRANWQAVFGRRPLAWALPIPATDAMVASRLGTHYRQPVAALGRSGELRVWQERHRDWERSHPDRGCAARAVPGLGHDRPTGWLFWWPAENHLGAGAGVRERAGAAAATAPRVGNGEHEGARAADGVFAGEQGGAGGSLGAPLRHEAAAAPAPDDAPDEDESLMPGHSMPVGTRPLRGALVRPGELSRQGRPKKSVRLNV